MSTSTKSISSVYGPVPSWRVGQSLGIDLICETSVCSFNCAYCQLGSIQIITNQRKLFISTEKVIQDFKESDWKKSDIITYSGSGEPTLATNLGDVARKIRKITEIPQLVLTNGTQLNNPEVISDLRHVQRVYVKLDAASEKVFQRVNRPVDGVTLANIVQWTKDFKKRYSGFLGIQIMFLPMNRSEVEGISEILQEIGPDEVQLNTPTRPYPRSWHIASRGGHSEELRPYESVPLRAVTLEDAEEIERALREKTGLKILSVYQKK
ncbi:MAG: radical SAM protein [Candidatus Omnitrophica bacterium]|nr:radical SAM protein [Candidatus Omnitrophota bacterium]